MKNKITDKLEINIFGVGFGDCIHITDTDDNEFLIDSGLIKTYDRIAQKLKEKSKNIDYVILTHDHSDHIAGLNSLLEDDEFEIKGVIFWIGKDTSIGISNSNRLQKIGDLLKTQDITVFSIDHLADEYHPIKKENIKILYPFSYSKYYNNNKNKNSIVIAFKIDKYNLLFMGDATESEEKLIIEKYKNEIDFSKTCLVKIGHHGSSTSSNIEFLNKLFKNYFKLAVCSCKENWDSAPPDKDKIKDIQKLLKKNNGKLVCTGKNDTKYDIQITLEIKNGELDINKKIQKVIC